MRRQLSVGAMVLAMAVAALSDVEPESNKREDQFYSESEARIRVFGPDLTWRDTVIVLDAEQAKRLHKETGLRETDTLVRLSYALDADEELTGVYRIASELGKYRPFDFLVGLGSNLKVQDVVVLNYRESHGGEVRRERFLRQYRGKSARSPVRLNRDVLGISGATLSAWAVNRGVKKTLWWADRIWGEGEHSK